MGASLGASRMSPRDLSANERAVDVKLREHGQAAFGRIGEEEKTFVPESEWPKVIREARI